MKVPWHKQRRNKGMTLLETMFTILLIAFLTTMVLTGSQVAARVSVQTNFAAESQMVADTINKGLSDVLRYAVKIKTNEEGFVTSYTNTGYGIQAGVIGIGSNSNGDGGMIFLDNGGERHSGPIWLLSNLSYSHLMVVPPYFNPETDEVTQFFDLRYSDGVFTGSYRLYNSNNHLLSEVYRFSFRALNN